MLTPEIHLFELVIEKIHCVIHASTYALHLMFNFIPHAHMTLLNSLVNDFYVCFSKIMKSHILSVIAVVKVNTRSDLLL